ncbi:MAG: hypothetical protein LBR70_04925 [Lactobacillaceae bacterium]|jgi:hypothetical protein|nr:hypothetical protein [Lactobacillaceae bacterium]
MKNPFRFLTNLFGGRKAATSKENAAEVSHASTQPAEPAGDFKFPKNIEELKTLAKKAGNRERGKDKLLLTHVKSLDVLTVKQMKAIYGELSRSSLTDELADAVCEKVKKDPYLFIQLSVGNMGYYLDHFGFSSIIGLFDYTVIESGKNKEDSLSLLEQVRRTTCWAHYEDESSRRAYIKYFSFGDGKDLLNKNLAKKFLSIIEEYTNREEAKELVAEGKMSEALYKKIY